MMKTSIFLGVGTSDQQLTTGLQYGHSGGPPAGRNLDLDKLLRKNNPQHPAAGNSWIMF
jgi:hypothetical protein